jgi:hypothetical protein
MPARLLVVGLVWGEAFGAGTVWDVPVYYVDKTTCST